MKFFERLILLPKSHFYVTPKVEVKINILAQTMNI
jgi:hypothetical protein